jgi:hypothetical protein
MSLAQELIAPFCHPIIGHIYVYGLSSSPPSVTKFFLQLLFQSLFFGEKVP